MVEITDEMAKRLIKAAGPHLGLPGGHLDPDEAKKSRIAQAKRILDAALNPPPEPEIVVTEEQRKVGLDLLYGMLDSLRANANVETCRQLVRNIYREMRRLEPKQPERRSGKDRRTGHGWPLGYGPRTTNGRRASDRGQK